ncbi:hypothetical protein ACT8ZV_22690 [Nocardioides sp. MAHUQ-72]|uniref:hypothetical protein n=1 Tax=unclassified Nocardioides TaxID=2615069 RepID=UPI00361DCF5F
MVASTPRDESMAALHAALDPYGWRSFTPELVARRVVAAYDRQALARLLGSVPGALVGAWEDAPGLADRGDPRVAGLREVLAAHPWTRLRLHAVCRLLVRTLDGGT